MVALNRFGLGARGGASGDFVNAASDPRGFVKAELGRGNAVLLEVPGLLSTPALGQALFEYQFEIKQAREAVAKSSAADSEVIRSLQQRTRNDATCRLTVSRCRWPRNPGSNRRRNPGRKPEQEPSKQHAANANATMTPAEAMQPNAAKAPPQPLNVIQKTFRAEALARLQRGVMADCGFVERLVVLVQSFLHLRQQGRAGADVGRLVRARGDPALRAGQFPDLLGAARNTRRCCSISTTSYRSARIPRRG